MDVTEEVADMKTGEELESNDKVESTEEVVQSSVVICSERFKECLSCWKRVPVKDSEE